MAFCSLSRELSMTAYTQIENVFLFEYMPALSGESTKVYLYGLYLCQNAPKDYSLHDMAEALSMTDDAVTGHFRLLEETGLVEIYSEQPFEVHYLSTLNSLRPKKFKPEKYTDFTVALQAMFPSRMVSTTEYRAYFQLMESHNVKPDALLMIVRYCLDKKGESITYRYILAVATDFAERGLLTAEAIENELSDYFGKSDAIDEVLKKLGIKRKAELSDLKYYEKWTVQLGFPAESVLYSAGKLKKGDFAKLDVLICDLYGAKAFGKKEIDAYLRQADETLSLARDLCKRLSVYIEVLDPVVSNYVSPWLAKGYDKDSILRLADYCFRTGKRSLEALNGVIAKLYERGIVSFTSILSYMEENRQTERATERILSLLGIDRKVTAWDRETYSVWKNQWNFSDEMIEYCARLSQGKNGPLAYMNAVLSSFKTDNIYTVEQAEARKSDRKQVSGNASFGQRSYTEAEIDQLFSGGEELL